MGLINVFLKDDRDNVTTELRAIRKFVKAFFMHQWNKGWICNYGETPIPDEEMEEIISAIVERREPALSLAAVAEGDGEEDA